MPPSADAAPTNPPAPVLSAPKAEAGSRAFEKGQRVRRLPMQDLGIRDAQGFFAGKIKKPKNDQFAGDFEKNSLVAGRLPFGSSWRRRLHQAETQSRPAKEDIVI